MKTNNYSVCEECFSIHEGKKSSCKFCHGTTLHQKSEKQVSALISDMLCVKCNGETSLVNEYTGYVTTYEHKCEECNSALINSSEYSEICVSCQLEMKSKEIGQKKKQIQNRKCGTCDFKSPNSNYISKPRYFIDLHKAKSQQRSNTNNSHSESEKVKSVRHEQPNTVTRKLQVRNIPPSKNLNTHDLPPTQQTKDNEQSKIIEYSVQGEATNSDMPTISNLFWSKGVFFTFCIVVYIWYLGLFIDKRPELNSFIFPLLVILGPLFYAAILGPFLFALAGFSLFLFESVFEESVGWGIRNKYPKIVALLIGLFVATGALVLFGGEFFVYVFQDWLLGPNLPLENPLRINQ